MSQNNSIREIAWRQHTAGRPNSFFKRINDILDMYQLPSFNEIMNQHYNKLDWKNIVRTAISSHWTVKLKADCEEISTLKLLSKTNLNIGQTHNVWDTISSSVKDVRKAETKVLMLTGTYMLQTLKVKFNQAEIDPTCPIKQEVYWKCTSTLSEVFCYCGVMEDETIPKSVDDLTKNLLKPRHNRYPRLVLSIIGDSSSFVPKPWLTPVFQLGLIETAKGAKDCLILYKGSAEKVSTLVWEAVDDFSVVNNQKNNSQSTESEDYFINLIGLRPGEKAIAVSNFILNMF
ncbi:unnamed protein product [Mytilus coruscus]|uniref:Uncharacterized protein n=1 Tax=Mytilus coruscus TaxID=42192 RepID=A0A6J8EBV6_MYTCO|nr:unnamed protein product [Mytilus coruscus]